jgi:hypothetical protein
VVGAGRVIATITIDLDAVIATILNAADPDKVDAIADGPPGCERQRPWTITASKTAASRRNGIAF